MEGVGQAISVLPIADPKGRFPGVTRFEVRLLTVITNSGGTTVTRPLFVMAFSVE